MKTYDELWEQNFARLPKDKQQAVLASPLGKESAELARRSLYTKTGRMRLTRKEKVAYPV